MKVLRADSFKNIYISVALVSSEPLLQSTKGKKNPWIFPFLERKYSSREKFLWKISKKLLFATFRFKQLILESYVGKFWKIKMF